MHVTAHACAVIAAAAAFRCRKFPTITQHLQRARATDAPSLRGRFANGLFIRVFGRAADGMKGAAPQRFDCMRKGSPTFLEETKMLYYAVVFFVIALIAALFGFGGIAAGAAGIAKILFVVFLIVSLVTFLLSLSKR